jgi:hypothetical protein
MKALWLRVMLTQLVIASGISGCATSLPAPELSDPGRVGIAIEISLRAPAGFFYTSPDQVFFAKVEGDPGILQQQIIRSNFVRGSRAYLLNGTEGKYVAVGAFFRMATGGIPKSYTTYFSQELIQKTLVSASPGELAYVGSYIVDQSVGLSGADAPQTHYQNVISPGAVTGGIFHVLGNDYHYRGGLVERKDDAQTRNDFRTKAVEDLAGSSWATRVK